MTDQPTCGEGLAEHSVLPARMAALLTSLAENLEAHMPALDLTDDDARTEYAAYERLALDHRSIAAKLRTIAEAMAGYRDLPMGRHEQEAMTSPRATAALERFAGAQRQLAELLEQRARLLEAGPTAPS